LAEELGAARTTAEAVCRVYTDAVSAGHGREPIPEMINVLGGE